MTHGTSDVSLARAAQFGDAASLGALLERHRAQMLALAVGILGHGPQAEDAVQDACLIAVRRIGELREPSAVRAWLLTIVTNACRAQLRRPGVTVSSDANELPDVSTLDTAERAIEQSALRDWLWTALERLSEPLRLVVILRYFTAADSYEAIASVCGIPVGTVRSRLSAAKANLAEELLTTAAQQHVHPGGLHDRHGPVIAEAMTAFQREGDQRALAEAFAPDLGFVMFDRVERSGLDNFAAALTHDYDDGVTVRPIRMVTSSDVTVLEAWLDSPPESPLHAHPRSPKFTTTQTAPPNDSSPTTRPVSPARHRGALLYLSTTPVRSIRRPGCPRPRASPAVRAARRVTSTDSPAYRGGTKRDLLLKGRLPHRLEDLEARPRGRVALALRPHQHSGIGRSKRPSRAGAITCSCCWPSSTCAVVERAEVGWFGWLFPSNLGLRALGRRVAWRASRRDAAPRSLGQ